MKKQIIWLVVLLTTITVNESFAQSGMRYPYMQSGKIIVNRDVRGGVKESLLHRKWDVSNPIPVHNEQSAANAVSAKFEVATSDCNSSNAPGVAQSSGKYTWANAGRACAAYRQSDADAGSWRLPTQRELMLMWIYKDELGNFASSRYWSATENSNDANNAWPVNFDDGVTGSYGSKTTAHSVRCVRDL